MNHIKSLFTLLILACFSCCLNGSLLLARSADTQSSSVLAQPVDEQNSLLLEQSTSEAGLSLLTLSAGETSSLSPVNISLHMRSAYHNEFVGSPLKFDDGGFRFDQVIVDVAGEISPKLSYKYLQRLNKASPIFTKENLPNSIDYAYLRYRFNERFSVTAGKQALTIGGFEYKSTRGGGDYAVNNLVNCYLNGLQWRSPLYKPGVHLSGSQQSGYGGRCHRNTGGKLWRRIMREAPTVPLWLLPWLEQPLL